MKGLLVGVYRFPGTDCTAGGLSSQKDRLILVGGPDGTVAEGPFTVQPDQDYLVLTRVNGRLRATPKSLLDAKKWEMNGGNFIYSSDDRFTALNDGHPIPVFDRAPGLRQEDEWPS